MPFYTLFVLCSFFLAVSFLGVGHGIVAFAFFDAVFFSFRWMQFGICSFPASVMD
jgi:hypothetical protein